MSFFFVYLIQQKLASKPKTFLQENGETLLLKVLI